jgi:predicted HicB family RNase H-like nuclease
MSNASGPRRGPRGSSAVRWLMAWDEELDEAAKRYASAERVSLTEWVRELVRREVRRREAMD